MASRGQAPWFTGTRPVASDIPSQNTIAAANPRGRWIAPFCSALPDVAFPRSRAARDYREVTEAIAAPGTSNCISGCHASPALRPLLRNSATAWRNSSTSTGRSSRRTNSFGALGGVGAAVGHRCRTAVIASSDRLMPSRRPAGAGWCGLATVPFEVSPA